MAKCQSLFSGGYFIHMGCLCPCFRAVLFIVKKKAAPHEAAFSPQGNPVPFHPLCPMSSVSAWSTAAAVWGTTARAIHESPVISAEIDDEVLDFSAIFSVYTDFHPFSGKGEGKGGTFSAFHHSIESFLMANWETYGVISGRTAGLSCPSTI